MTPITNDAVEVSDDSFEEPLHSSCSKKRDHSDDKQIRPEEEGISFQLDDLLDQGGCIRNKKTKRMRISDEKDYTAANILNEPRTAGMPYPPLPLGEKMGESAIDLSVVEHITSRQHSSTLPKICSSGTSQLFEPEANDCLSLIDSCRSFYTLTHVLHFHDGISNESDITYTDRNSSETSIDNDGNQSSTWVIEPRLDDALSRQAMLDSDDGGEYRNDQENNCPTNSFVLMECSLSSLMTLAQAMAFYPKPRLVAQAIPPFLVVHANAAYTHLTGFQTDEILGHPLKTRVSSSNEENLSLTDLSKMSETGEDIPIDVTVQKSDVNLINPTNRRSIRCHMCVLPVVCDVKSAIVDDEATPFLMSSNPNSFFSSIGPTSESVISDKEQEVMKVSHFVVEICYFPVTGQHTSNDDEKDLVRQESNVAQEDADSEWALQEVAVVVG